MAISWKATDESGSLLAASGVLGLLQGVNVEFSYIVPAGRLLDDLENVVAQCTRLPDSICMRLLRCKVKVEV